MSPVPHSENSIQKQSNQNPLIKCLSQTRCIPILFPCTISISTRPAIATARSQIRFFVWKHFSNALNSSQFYYFSNTKQIKALRMSVICFLFWKLKASVRKNFVVQTDEVDVRANEKLGKFVNQPGYIFMPYYLTLRNLSPQYSTRTLTTWDS